MTRQEVRIRAINGNIIVWRRSYYFLIIGADVSVTARVRYYGITKANYKADGYGVYDKIGQGKGIALVGCLVHARRGFEKALDGDRQRAQKAMVIFCKIYQLETQSRGFSDLERYSYRNKHIWPLIHELKEWAEQESCRVLPKRPTGKAIGYYQAQYPKLLNLFKEGRYELDNNLIENKIRPLALSRNNYLFAASHQVAQRIAMMYSFFGCCAANSTDPYNWLMKTLKVINDTRKSELDALLPASVRM